MAHEGSTTNHNQLLDRDSLLSAPFGVVPELLAPAGGPNQFFAALRAGADAVFLGLKEFNARSRAANFTVDELTSLMPLARRYKMKVLVTVNVLIKDIELSTLLSTLSQLEVLAVDAIIVQDLAVARIVRRHFPELRLHASTQLAVHNLAGVLQAAEWGFKRVVLARELTALEIRKIRQAIDPAQVELEAFCHGSLCYSYSGLCFFSGAEDGRSGNRGECAYTCREPYKIVSEDGHGFLFSMKDLDTADDLKLFSDSGVHTLKIEGRKKDAQYVTSVVRLYREKLDQLFGRSTLRPEARELVAGAHLIGDESAIRSDLDLSFQRQPTSFFLKGRYHENVIDLDNPTHSGRQVGTVEQVRGREFLVQVTETVARFDGLRINPDTKAFHATPQHGEEKPASKLAAAGKMRDRYEAHPCEFSLRTMHKNGKLVPTASAGEKVWIELSSEAAIPKVGDLVFKVRSSDLKSRVDRLAVPPPDARLRPFLPLDLAITITDGGDERLEVKAQATRFGEPVTAASVMVSKVKSTNPSASLPREVTELFSLFGDDGFEVATVNVFGPTDWFVPRAELKRLKKMLREGLAVRFADVLAARLAKAKAKVTKGTQTLKTPDQAQFIIKIDRLEYLGILAEYTAKHGDFSVAEVVFEPKKSFLPTLKSEDFLNALGNFSAQTSIPFRLALPTVIRGWDEPVLRKWLEDAAAAGVQRLEIGNVGAFKLLRDWGLLDSKTAIDTDFTLYALNREATRFWGEQGVEAVTLSLEDDLENLTSHLRHWPADVKVVPQVIMFKDTPLFVAESCSLTALHNGCPTAKVCGYRTLEIENTKGERFFVAHEACKSIVYGKNAYSITQHRRRLMALGVGRFRLDFLTRVYDGAAMVQILDSARAGTEIPGTHGANFMGKLQ